MIEHTLQAWATALGMERRTLEARLVRAGLRIKAKGSKYSAKEVYVAMIGDKEAEQVRALKLENEERERRAAEAAGSLIRVEALESWLSPRIGAVAELIDTMAITLDTRCNPADPASARAVIADYVETSLKPKIRALLESPDKR